MPMERNVKKKHQKKKQTKTKKNQEQHMNTEKKNRNQLSMMLSAEIMINRKGMHHTIGKQVPDEANTEHNSKIMRRVGRRR